MKVMGIATLVLSAWCVVATAAQANIITGSSDREIEIGRQRTATFWDGSDEFFFEYCVDVGRDVTVPEWPEGRSWRDAIAQIAKWSDDDDVLDREFDGPFKFLRNGDVAPRPWHYPPGHFKDWKEDWANWKHRFAKHRRFAWRVRRGPNDEGDNVDAAAVPAPEPASLVLFISAAALGLKRGLKRRPRDGIRRA